MRSTELGSDSGWNIGRHGVEILDTWLVLRLETRNGRQNRALRLRHIHTARGEGVPVAQILHIEQQILVNVARGDEIPVDRMGRRSSGTVFDAAMSDCEITWPPYTRPVGKYMLSPLI